MNRRANGWDDAVELEKCEDMDREVRHMRRLAQMQAMAKARGEEEESEDEHPPKDTSET